MYRLILLLNESSQPVFEVNQEEMTLGRDPANAIHIPDPAISRHHARVRRTPEGVRIEDLGSANGTFVNGVQLSASRLLQSGDEVRLGQALTLRFEGPTASSPPAGSLPAAAPPTGAFLVVQVGSSPAQRFALNRTSLSLGRDPGNDITVESRMVSRRHARLERAADGGYMLIILPDASNPIMRQQQPLSGAYALRPGELLYIPSPDPALAVTLVYELTGAGSHPPTPTYASTPPGSNPPTPSYPPAPSYPPPGSHPPLGSPATQVVNLPYEFEDGGLIGSPSAPGAPAGSGAGSPPSTRRVDFGAQSVLRIGRDPTNDVVLDHPTVSRFHAQVERLGERTRLRDLNSANGTFVNNQPIVGETWITAQDHVRIGPFRFEIGKEALAQFDESGGLRIDAVALNKWVRKDLNLLQNISLSIQPREFVVVVGQSGGGKTTLVDSLAGYRPASHGKVYINGIDIYENFEAVRSEIGYVPQRDIIHMELTVYQALDYAARLRMPSDTSTQERKRRVVETLKDLDLEHRADVQISRLSGGQQKRVSIGVELLTRPGLFFLDEPTSGLDPGGETALMQLMRRLTDGGRTVVLITHATKNVMLADKVVFLARGGHLAWFGPPTEALAYFDQYRSERDRRAGPMEFDQIYALLDDASKGNPVEWAKRYLAHAACKQYIWQPLARQGRLDGLVSESAIRQVAGASPGGRVAERRAPARLPKRRTASSLTQFFILSSRNLKILTRDRFSLLLMLVVAPITGLLSFILSGAIGRNPYDYVYGYFPGVTITIFTLPVFGVLVGCLAQMREFVKEVDIYKRERLVNLRIIPYVLSKIWVALLLALYQAMTYVIIHYLAFDVPGGLAEFVLIYITTALAVLAGMMLGLLASALAPNGNSAPLVMILFIIPQIVLAGVLVKLPDVVTFITSTRWGHEAILTITGAGSDPMRDPCWAMDKRARLLMTLDEKHTAGCNCSGLDALRQESCDFPGVGQFYDPVLDQPAPVEPAPIGDPPPEPVFPPQPAEPANTNDPVAMGAYLQSLKAYQSEVEKLRTAYSAELSAYQQVVDAYQSQRIAYEKDRAAWEIGRNAAVGKAESLIEPMYRDHSWAFADKTNPSAYYGKIFGAWLAQGIIMAVAFFAILLLIKRKDYTA